MGGFADVFLRNFDFFDSCQIHDLIADVIEAFVAEDIKIGRKCIERVNRLRSIFLRRERLENL